MKRFRRRMIFFLIILMLVNSLTGCTIIGEPGLESAEAHLQQDMDDILFLVDWLQSSGYTHIIFKDSFRTAWADFETIQVNDDIQPIMKKLLKESGYYEIVMSKNYNQIRFCYWRSSHDQECGIVYSLNHLELPHVQYATQCEPLSVEGWYYYFSDYNKWRIGETTSY